MLRAQSATFLRAQITLANNANNGLEAPWGIAVDTQGDVYIADWSGRVLKETPSGVGFGGFSQSTVASGLTQPDGVAVDGEGNVYIAEPGSGQVLKETLSAGAYTQSVFLAVATSAILQPCGLAFDTGGNLYVTDFDGGSVYKETFSGNSVNQSLVATSASNGLFEPMGVAVDSSGNVYIADAGNNRIVKETLSNGSYTQSVVASGLDVPFGVTVDSGGNLYVADTRNNRVVKETPSNGTYTQSVLLTGLSSPIPIAVDSNGFLYVGDTGNERVIEEKSSQVDFGAVTVTATSASIALTFKFSSAVTLGSKTPYQILTMGAAGLDFGDAGSATCTGTAFSSGSTCTVNVTFSPTLAGTRNGAVNLIDSSGNVQATAYIAGTGQAPQIGYSAAAQTVIVPCCAMWPAGVAVDGSGNVYISDQSGNQVVKEAPNYGAYIQGVVANAATSGISEPAGVAVDGAGYVYIADPYNNRILKMTPSSSGYTYTQVTTDCKLCQGVAVDGSGNVYVADSGNNRVLKETLVSGGYTETIIANTANNGIESPYGVAVDGDGNVYIADTFGDSDYRVFKETLKSGGTYTQSVVTDAAAGGLDEPWALAVDGVGNVYIADKMNFRILRETLLPGGTYAQYDVAGATEPQGVAVDGSGNLYFSDPYNRRALLVAMGSSPTLGFGTVAYGDKSAIESIQVLNNGNETLNAVSPGISVPPGWTQVTGSGPPADCTAGFTLAEGAACNFSFQLSPLPGEFGSLIGNAGITDNNLNKNPGTQAIQLTGTTVMGTPVITWATPMAIPLGTALSGTQLNAAANIPGTFVYSPLAGTVLTQGEQTLSVTFTPADTTDYTTATATVTIVVYPPEQMSGTSQWVWMGGSNTLSEEVNQSFGVPGVYGLMGVAAVSDIPGGRSYSSQWTDSGGNFWLFGGWGYDSVSTQGELNDLWEFSPSTQEWSWRSGSSTETTNNPMGTNGQWGVYGTLNTPAPTNVPGGRDSASTWTDSSGNFWLFGGEGIDSAGNYSNYLNDLWEYTPAINTWIWRGGNSVACTSIPDEETTCGYNGVYTSSTTPLAPGSRMGASSWTDSSGNFWLFGGNGQDSVGAQGDMNDLWKYSPSTATWAWVGGSSTGSSPGNYSTDVSAPLVPSARDSATTWVDTSGSFWLFGGEGVDSTGTQGILNDLWEYVPSTGLWAWVSGSSTVPAAGSGQPGVYGSLNVPASGNTPGGRWGATGLLNKNGNLLMFAGLGFDSNGTLGDQNDAWMFNLSLKEWIWKGGQTTVDCKNCGWPGVYGTLGVPAAANTPGGRVGSSAWIDSGGNGWLFGGSGADSTGTAGSLNDLWAVGTPAAQPTFNPLPGKFTQSQLVTINDTTQGAVIYFTTDGSAPTVLSTQYKSAFEVSQSETITAIAMAAGYITSPPASASYSISPTPLAITWPAPAPITYGTALSSTQLNATANVAGSFAYTPPAGTVLGAGTQTLSAKFTPTDTIDYSVTTLSVPLTVNQATPVITWPTPSTIIYGIALSAKQLDATANTAGTFSYTPAAGGILTAGSQTLSVTFTPADTTDYTTATASVTLTVNPATPKIQWATPAAIVYGTALSTAQLDAMANTEGAFSYTPAVGTVPAAGKPTLTVTFTPADATDYTTAQASVTLVVTKLALTVTASDASVLYGRPIPVLTYTIAGFVNGDTVAVVSGAATETTSASLDWAPGTYPITISQGTLSAANYVFVFVDGTLTITPLGVTPKPAFSPKPGISFSSRTVKITCEKPGAMIFYALHGEKPTIASHRYMFPITITTTETINAIAIVKGYAESEVVTATYTIE